MTAARLAPIAAIALVLAIAAAIDTGCSVAHRSDNFACESQADCSNGRMCSDGLCIVGFGNNGPNDAPNADCPAQCTSCDRAEQSCVVDCDSAPELCQRAITCPAGWSCDIRCTGNDSCSAVDCNAAAACEITCDGNDSCSQIACGTARCDITCNGLDSCAAIDCTNACACMVRCEDDESCAALSCPATCGSQAGCTSRRPGCDTCL